MRRCLKCGTHKNITRDHVVSRVLLRRVLTLDTYQKFSTESRDVNIQPLCRRCNNEKGGTAVDYRDMEDHVKLLMLLDRWNLDIDVEVGKPYKSRKMTVRHCQLHGTGNHSTDNCFLFDNIPMLLDHVSRMVEEYKIVDEEMKRRDARRARRLSQGLDAP